jgi:hypothetical protein
MLIQEVSTKLRDEGFSYCWIDSIAVAVATGKIPKPPHNAAGQLVFDSTHLEALRQAFGKAMHRR